MRLVLLVLLVLGGGGCDGGFDGLPPGGFGVFTETTTSKQLTFTLDDLNPIQRFDVPASVDPSSFDAHFDVAITRTDSSFLLEFTDEEFASDDPAFWTIADVGFAFRVGSSGTGADRLRLSIARDDVDAGQDVSIDVALSLAAPNDVDFDGADDNVEVVLGSLEPVIVE